MTLSLQLSAKVWQSRLFHRVFHWYNDYPTERINALLSHMDGRTFFETAKIILSYRQPCPFQRLPYALILSETDKTVKNDRLLKLFKRNVENLKIVEVATDHYPLEITSDYFRSRFPGEAIEEIILFFNGKPSKTG